MKMLLSVKKLDSKEQSSGKAIIKKIRMEKAVKD